MTKKQSQKKKDEQLTEVEYTDALRKTNEVASTSYLGSREDKTDLQQDRLETGGF